MANRVTHHPIVGEVHWRPLDEGRIDILGSWEEENITVIDIPELKGTPTYGGKCGGRIQWYKGTADQMKAAWKEIGDHNLMDRVLFWSGSFVPRMVRGSTRTPSNHTFGTAFDINHQWNGLGVTPPPSRQKGSVRELVPFFEKYGFFWGGNYARRRDGMHFEVERREMPKPKETAPPSIEIFLDGRQEVVPALFMEEKTWVGVRALAKRLSGTVDEVQMEPFKVRLTLKGTRKEYKGHCVGGVGYIAFSEVMELYKLPFNCDLDKMRIDIYSG